MFKSLTRKVNELKSVYLSNEFKQIFHQQGLRAYIRFVPYYFEVKRQSDIYFAWIEKNERMIYKKKSLKKRILISIVIFHNERSQSSEACVASIRAQTYHKWEIVEVKNAIIDYSKINGTYLIIMNSSDILAPNALYEVVKMLNIDSSIDFIYSDSDAVEVKNGSKERKDHFFRPDWSPDTFLSFCYTGSLAVLRKSIAEQIIPENSLYPQIIFYDLLLKFTEQTNRIAHIPKILYHSSSQSNIQIIDDCRMNSDNEKNSFINLPIAHKTNQINQQDVLNHKEEYYRIKQEMLKRRNLNGELVFEPEVGDYRIKYFNKSDPLVSIIIPSKDHFEILSECVKSVKKVTDYNNYEILIIDNGSGEENRKIIEAMCSQYNCSYLYRSMEFNFSKMCNIGAEQSKGSYLIFLNDDIEIIQKDWLRIMLGHGSLSYAGAVGAKLLYPDSNIIQHIGVTNLEVGPVHKETLFTDDCNYYHGRNRVEYNYIAVTGACLLIKKSKFQEVSGFDEAMKVAYNDVELGIRLYKKGYFNVVRNDVVLFHHESISRGNDNLNKEKYLRLKSEREYMYQKHPDVEKTDPFYNPNLIGCKSIYEPDLIYDFEKRDLKSEISLFTKSIKQEWINESIKFCVEEITIEEDNIYLEGWSYVGGADNCIFKRSILLLGENIKEPLEISVFERYRDDVKNCFPEEKNIEMSGFVCHIPVGALKKNLEYEICLFLKAKLSRQTLFIASDRKLMCK